MEETTKLKVAVELKNGDYHKVECSTIEIDKHTIEIFGEKGDIINLNIEDIDLLAISRDREGAKEKLTLRLVREPKENLWTKKN